MDFVNPWIPAVIIVFSNVFGGEHDSERYSVVTAFFGWLAGICILLWLLLSIFRFDFSIYFFQVGMFGMITAVSRDYERIFKTIFKSKGK
jgi:hypothetical protein